MDRSTSAWILASLSWALKDPKPELLVQDRENELLAALGMASIQNPGSGWSKVFDGLWNSIGGLGRTESGRCWEAMRVEQARLFYGPPFPAVMPYEHAYREEGDAGTLCSSLEAEYNSKGFAVCDDFHDLPDHICVQLDFAAVLLQRDLELEATKFRSGHLQEFLVAFAKSLQAETRLGFFSVIAGVMLRMADETDWCHCPSKRDASETGSSREPASKTKTPESGVLESQEARE